MTPREVDFLRRLVAGRPAERRCEGVAARMAEQAGLGVVRGAKVVYSDADFIHAENLLFTQSAHVSRVNLNRVQDGEIALAWRRLKLLTLGLNQEGFPR